MQVLILLGKALAGLFWLAFAATLGQWLGSPFDQLLYLLAGLFLGLHGLQLWLFAGLLKARANPGLDRLQILLFGVFHLFSLKPVLPVEEPAGLPGDEAVPA